MKHLVTLLFLFSAFYSFSQQSETNCPVNFSQTDFNGYRCNGSGSAKFTVSGTVPDFNGVITLQWQASPGATGPWSDLPLTTITVTGSSFTSNLTADYSWFNFTGLDYNYRLSVSYNGCTTYAPAGRVITKMEPIVIFSGVFGETICDGEIRNFNLFVIDAQTGAPLPFFWSNSKPELGMPPAG